MPMLRAGHKSVDDYIGLQPPSVQAVLERVRNTIRKALPGAEEVISYQMPAYRLHGRVVIYFAGWKEHYAVYPATGRVGVELKDELAKYNVSKGTIRFPLDEPVPVRLITRIAKLRAEEAEELTRAQASKRKTRPAGKKG